jgi:hypothetical protein
VTDIGQISRLNNQVVSVGIAKSGRAVGSPAQPSPIDSLGLSPQMRLPVEDALREVARGVTDFIVSNGLTLVEGYQVFRAELVSATALSLISVSEMELIEKLAQGLLGKTAIGPLTLATIEKSTSSVARAGEGLLAVNADDTLEQMLERISQTFAGSPVLPEPGEEQPGVVPDKNAEPLVGLEEKVVMSWRPGSTLVQDTGDGLTPGVLVLSRNGFLDRLVGLNSPSAPVNSPANGPSAAPVAQFPEGGQGLVSGAGIPPYAASLITSVPRQPGAGAPPAGTAPAFSGQSSDSPALLRLDLKELLGDKPAELRIRYDEALIVSKVAVLLEQMNGLVRVCEEQGKAASNSRQTPSSDLNRTLRQILATALGIVIDGNKTFKTPFSVGVSGGRDGLLTLDPAVLRSALGSHREEAAAVLKSLANSFYDNISLFVDPRILARFSEIIGNGEMGKAGRSKREKERRWKKDKDLLEKRFLELNLILEESGKLREWFIAVVESSGRSVPDSDSDSEVSWKEASCRDKGPEPSDEVVRRALPAVDLPWDQEEFSVADRPEALKENPVTLFIACSTRALQEEDAGRAIKMLLKRKVLSDKLLAERPDLEPKVAMVCLANEELLLGRLEAERTKLFKNLDELSRTMVAARGYRPQFPFPPPMAAFIASEG